MKTPNQFPAIFLWREQIDFRKSINGLSALVQEEMKLNPYSDSLFVFCCRRRKRIKILYWDRTGFALWYKRLEEDRFPWPRLQDMEVVEINSREMEWILEGIDIWKIKPHEDKKYSTTC